MNCGEVLLKIIIHNSISHWLKIVGETTTTQESCNRSSRATSVQGYLNRPILSLHHDLVSKWKVKILLEWDHFGRLLVWEIASLSCRLWMLWENVLTLKKTLKNVNKHTTQPLPPPTHTHNLQVFSLPLKLKEITASLAIKIPAENPLGLVGSLFRERQPAPLCLLSMSSWNADGMTWDGTEMGKQVSKPQVRTALSHRFTSSCRLSISYSHKTNKRMTSVCPVASLGWCRIEWK